MPDPVITTTTIAPEVIIREVASPVSNLELILILSGIFATIAIGGVAAIWAIVSLLLRGLDKRHAEDIERLSTEIRDTRTETHNALVEFRTETREALAAVVAAQHATQLELVRIRTREETLREVAGNQHAPATTAAPPPAATASEPEPTSTVEQQAAAASDTDEAAAATAKSETAEQRAPAARPRPSSSEPAAPAEPAPPVEPVRHVTPAAVAQPGTING